MAKNLLSISDLSKQDMLDLIEFSNNFIDDQGNFRKEDLFPDKIVANVFCEPSTRTKLSFAIAASNLGCSVIDFDINTSSIQKGESMYETEEEWEEYMKELERTRKALESKPCILETLFNLYKLLVVLGLFALIFLF